MAKNSGCGMGCGSVVVLLLCMFWVVIKAVGFLFGNNDPSDNISQAATSSYSYSELLQYESSDSVTESTTAPEVKMSKKEYIASCSNYSDSDFQTKKEDAVGKHVKVKLLIAGYAHSSFDVDAMGNPKTQYWKCNIYNKKYGQYASHPLYFEDTGNAYDGYEIKLYDKVTIYGTVTDNSAPLTWTNDGSVSVPFIDVKYIKYDGKFGE